MDTLRHYVCERHSVTLDVVKTHLGEEVDDRCCFCTKPMEQVVTVLNTPKDCQHLDVAVGS
jgi:hypothetical protein